MLRNVSISHVCGCREVPLYGSPGDKQSINRKGGKRGKAVKKSQLEACYSGDRINKRGLGEKLKSGSAASKGEKGEGVMGRRFAWVCSAVQCRAEKLLFGVQVRFGL